MKNKSEKKPPVKTVKIMEIKKMKQGMSYSCKEKTIILNVFKYMRVLFPDSCVTELVRHTSKATGCSEKSIFQFRKEETSPEGFREPSKTKERKIMNINSRFMKYDITVRQGIRSIVYKLKERGIVPSLSIILKNVNSDVTLPNFSIMTLRRLLLDMGFYYEKDGNKSVLVEKFDFKIGDISGKSKLKPKKSTQASPAEKFKTVQTTFTSAINRSDSSSVKHSLPTNTNVHNVNNFVPAVIQQPQSSVPLSNIYPQTHHIPAPHHEHQGMLPPPHHHPNIMAPIHNPHSVPVMFDSHHGMAPMGHHPLHGMSAPNVDMHLRKDIGGIMHQNHVGMHS